MSGNVWDDFCQQKPNWIVKFHRNFWRYDCIWFYKNNVLPKITKGRFWLTWWKQPAKDSSPVQPLSFPFREMTSWSVWKGRFFSDHLCNTFLPSYDVVLKRTETKKSSRLHWVVFFYDLSKNKNPIITKTKPSK